MTAAFGIGVGFALGAGTVYGIMRRYIAHLMSGAGEHPGVIVERDRSRRLHRRAQVAEGRLQRINHILAEGDEG